MPNRAQDGAILAVPVWMADRRERSDRKIVSQCRDQARWAYNGVIFEVKKEIPVYRLVLWTEESFLIGLDNCVS